MPILSRKDLERISRRVLFRYLTLSDRKMDRIDPVDFAEKICGLHFAFADMSVTGSILGLTSYSDVDLTISVPRGNGSVQEFHLNGNIAYVDQNLANAGSVGRLNFTLVHEAAHQILSVSTNLFRPHFVEQRRVFSGKGSKAILKIQRIADRQQLVCIGNSQAIRPLPQRGLAYIYTKVLQCCAEFFFTQLSVFEFFRKPCANYIVLLLSLSTVSHTVL